jgi:hypothetical protein
MIKKSGALEYEKEGKNAGCWVVRLVKKRFSLCRIRK